MGVNECERKWMSNIPNPYKQGSFSSWRLWSQNEYAWEGKWAADGWRTQSRKYLDTNDRWACSTTAVKLNTIIYPTVWFRISVNECSLQCFLICLYCSGRSKTKLGGTVPRTFTGRLLMAFCVLVLCKAMKIQVACVKTYIRMRFWLTW